MNPQVQSFYDPATFTFTYVVYDRDGGHAAIVDPVLADTFQLSNLKHVDRRLLGGAALFGIGWGIAGYCPGPALAGLGIGSIEALWFIPAMLAGILLHRLVNRA